MILPTTIGVTAASLLVICYVAYPLALWAVCALRGRGGPAQRQAAEVPSATVVIPARNEALHIEAKVKALIQHCDHLPDIDVIVVSDGSTDATVAIARKLATEYPRVSVVELGEGLGKAGAINRAVAHVRNDVVIVTDANTMVSHGAIEQLLTAMADPDVGCAVGEKVVSGEPGSDCATGEGLYWRYEGAVKALEAKLGSTLGCDGALFAVRRELLPELPADMLCEDLYVALHARMRGKRVAYCPDAVVVEACHHSALEEIRRKRRTVAGGLQAVGLALVTRPSLPGWMCCQIVFHKLLRWMTPWLLLAMLTSSGVLARQSCAWLALFALQIGGYSCCAVALLAGDAYNLRLPKFLALLGYFAATMVGTLWGTLPAVAARPVPWYRVARAPTAAPARGDEAAVARPPVVHWMGVSVLAAVLTAGAYMLLRPAPTPYHRPPSRAAFLSVVSHLTDRSARPKWDAGDRSATASAGELADAIYRGLAGSAPDADYEEVRRKLAELGVYFPKDPNRRWPWEHAAQIYIQPVVSPGIGALTRPATNMYVGSHVNQH